MRVWESVSDERVERQRIPEGWAYRIVRVDGSVVTRFVVRVASSEGDEKHPRKSGQLKLW
jgi:hypothetical protein